MSDAPFFHGANANTFRNAEDLRKNMTRAEQILWQELKGNKISSLRFRRQHSISGYIVDFYCHKAKLIIEVDGSIHNLADITENDKQREFNLKALGFKIIRFTNEEVESNIENVIKRIKKDLP